MQDWVVTTLKSVQLYAYEKGFADLAEEMNVAILVAAEEYHRREEVLVGEADVKRTEQHSGPVVEYPGYRRIGRHH